MILYLIISIFITISFLTYTRFYNPFIIGGFIVIFQFGVGKLIRDIGFGLKTDIFVELLVGTYLLGVFIGIILLSKFKPTESKSEFRLVNSNESVILVILLGICAVILASQIYSAVSEFGLLGIRKFYHDNRSDRALSILFVLIGVLGPILALHSLQNKKIMMFLFCIFCILLIGKKAPFFAICFGYIYLKSIEGVLAKRIMPVILMVTSLLVFHNLSTTTEDTPLRLLAGYFDYYHNLEYVLAQSNAELQTPITNGQIFLSKFYSIVPRAIWPNKPEIYGHLLIHQKLFANELATGYTRGIGSTIAVPFFDGGIIWLFLSGIIKGMAASVLYNLSIASKKYRQYFFIMIVLGTSIKVIGILLIYIIISKVRSKIPIFRLRRKLVV